MTIRVWDYLTEYGAEEADLLDAVRTTEARPP